MYNYDRRRIQKIGGTIQRGHSIRSTSRHRQDDRTLAVEPIVDYTKRAYSGTVQFKISARNMLQKRGLLPSRYDVIRGEEDIQLDFDVRL